MISVTSCSAACGVFAAHDQTFLGGTTGRRWKLIRPFVQDDWRVTSSLTLNLGFAWALATPETEVENRMANFDILNLKWYAPKGSPTLSSCTVCIPSGSSAGVKFDSTAIEPRIGFAWKVAGSDKTVLRGGYGILHDSAWNQGGQGLWQRPTVLCRSRPVPDRGLYSSRHSGLRTFERISSARRNAFYGCGRWGSWSCVRRARQSCLIYRFDPIGASEFQTRNDPAVQPQR